VPFTVTIATRRISPDHRRDIKPIRRTVPLHLGSLRNQKGLH
jgi:hypothetical protein